VSCALGVGMGLLECVCTRSVEMVGVRSILGGCWGVKT
jgi:hypothetical protein